MRFRYTILVALIIYSISAAAEDEQPQNKGDNNKIPKSNKLLRRTPQANIYYSKECADDILRFCPRARKMELSDVAVLQCIHNEVQDLNLIDKECHNLLYEYKKNLTLNLKLDNTALQVCKDDIENLSECQKVDPINGHLVSCLLDNKENVTNESCKTFLTNIAALVFSDFRLVYNFINDCQNDINKYDCGRLEKANDNLPTQQGKTIECLSKKFQDLEDSCKKQIVRITELQSDDFHLDRPLYFACREDRERLCESITSGEGRVYKCLMKNKFNQLMSKQCQEQLTRRQKIIAQDVKADKSLILACKKDIIQHHCRKELRNSNSETLQLPALILCLEGAVRDGESIEPECKAELVEHRKMLMSDYSLNPSVVKFCAKEITEHCGGGLKKNGETVHCLLNKAKEAKLKKKFDFDDKCLAELRLLLKISDASEDIRVDAHLQQSCQNLLTGPCKDVQPGEGRVIKCLVKFIGSSTISEDCEERLLQIQFFVARDWSLNPELYKSCKSDAVKHCKAKETWVDWSTDVDNGPLVLPCLFNILQNDDENDASSKDVKLTQKCAFQIKKLMETRAKSIDLVPEVQDECTYDLANLCSKGKINGKGEELRCLQANFKNLQDECKKAIEKYTVKENEDVRLDQILMNACMPTIDAFCAAQKEEKGELLNCLIKQKHNPQMDLKCKAGIEHHQLLNLENVSFNYKFKKSCETEIMSHCSSAKSKIDALHCLSEIVLNDTLLDKSHKISSKCRMQLKFEMLQMNENINLDPELASECQEDVQKLCNNVQAGKGQVLECLRDNRKDLSEGCKAKLFKRDKINLVDQNVDYALQTKCKNAIQQLCHVDGEEDVISCLRKHLLETSIEASCRDVVINRIMVQNKDSRLNQGLWKACSKDASKLCQTEFALASDLSQELNGRVLKCLKAQFVTNKLGKKCEVEVEQVMREAANVDYRLDPSIVDNCLSEIESLCSEEPNDKKENCLRLSFQKRKIDRSSTCFEEIRRIIIEGAADVFVDHELSQKCSNDLQRYCSDIAPGASQQLKCLLEVKNNQKNKLSESCDDTLTSRKELWDLANVSESINGISDLKRLINESENRSYLIFIMFSIIAIVFMLGCLCRKSLGRARRDKRK